MKRFSFITTGAPGGYEAGDPVFDSHDTLSYDIKNPPAELCEGAETDGDPVIEPGESIEWVYFWTTKDNYYGPITVQFDKNATGGTDPRTMRFDTTGKETDGYKAAVEAAEAIKVGTRNYARRQLIWFRRDTRIRWIPSTELSHAKERIIQDWEEHIR